MPMVDIFVRADGLKAEDAVKLVTEPLETIVKSIDSVEHVYSQTRDDKVMVTARFLVGTPSDSAILRVHEKLRANMDRIPRGIPEPLIVGRGIDDVAMSSRSVSPKPGTASRWTANDVSRVARELQVEPLEAGRHRPHLHHRPTSRRRSVSAPTPRSCRSGVRCNSSPPRSRLRTDPLKPGRCAMAESRSQ